MLFSLNFTGNLLYLDPASSSMLLSSITAIAVACGAGIFMFWRSMKKKVKKAFHIDENANKEMEDELVINDETDADTTAATDTTTADTADTATTTTKTTKSTTKKSAPKTAKQTKVTPAAGLTDTE